MKGLTGRQRAILAFIEEFMDANSMPPTVYEIAAHLNVKPPTVFVHLRSLKAKGHIDRTSKARSITITGAAKRQRRNVSRQPLCVPFADATSGGSHAELLCDPAILRGFGSSGAFFAVRQPDDSLKDFGILKGDMIVVRRAVHVEAGRFAVCLADGKLKVRLCKCDYEFKRGEPDAGVAELLQRKL